ncbi:hypothetical protein V1T76_08680 [Roseibium sp. FZY0029]|uniref:hypothetical protein n=1 Tax=Roseibium sp. FZY0029 TaxID=3116647 RepID=UPI002EC675FE|nr:hypothetical protein [Roseibium sp. FZY0029]
MADAPIVHIGENSPEEVALKLLNHISSVEHQPLYRTERNTPASREWILDTYAECLTAVRGFRKKK